jgi:hypothetical protein
LIGKELVRPGEAESVPDGGAKFEV